MAEDDIVLGRGFVTAEQDPQYQMMTQWSWDSAWVAIIYRMGLAGAVVFGALLAAYAVRAVRLFLRPDPWAEEYGLFGLRSSLPRPSVRSSGGGSWTRRDTR